MATLPNPDSITRETPRAVSSVESYQGGIEGSAIANAGNEIARFAEAEVARIDDAKVEQAATLLRQRRAELTLGEKGYRSVKGEGVISTPSGEKPFLDTFKERFNSAASEIEQGLNSPRQREIFAKAKAREDVSFQTDLMEHAMKESEAFKATAREGRINLELQNASFYAQEPDQLAESYKGINDVYNRMVLVDNIPADQVAQLRTATLSKFHTTVINELVAAGKVGEAQTYFDEAKKKKEILNPAISARQLETATAGVSATENAWAAFDSMYPETSNDVPTSDAGITALRKYKPDASPVEKERFLSAWDDRTSRRKDSFAQRDGAVYNMLAQGASPSKVFASKEFAALSDMDQAKVRNSIEKPADYVKLARVDALLSTPQKLYSMTRPEVLAYAQKHALGIPSAQALLAAHTEIQKPSALREAEVDNIDLKNAFLVSGEKVPKDNDENFIRAKVYMRDALSNAQAAEGRKLTSAERRKVYNDAMKEIVVSKGFFFDTKKPAYELTPEDIGTAQAAGTLPR